MEKDDVYEQFISLYPIERLESLKLEEYTNLTKDSFCYWVENKLNDWGNIHGATSYKFGIFRWGAKPELEKTSVLADDKYAWQNRFGKTAEEAFNNIHKKLIQLVKFAKNAEYEKIDAIDLSEMFKWKIAFLYSNKKLINWFSKEALIKFAQYYGHDVNNKTPTSELQKILLNEKGERSLEEFNKELQPIWDKIKSEGEWLPKDYNPGITVDQWKNIITDKSIFTDNSLITFACIIKAKNPTCTGMEKEFGRTKNFYNNNGWQTGKRVFDYFKLSPPKDENNQIWFWSSCCSFREDKEKRWEFKIHPELQEAFDETHILDNIDLYSKDGETDMSKAKELSILLKNTYNLILHGAPGTGKTYLAKAIATELGCTENEIGFVQFHPSYDYTDFVEGIRPSNSSDGITNSFERMDGVFKEFCKKALLSQTVDSTTISELRKDATVWKLSLKGTGDNPIRRDCLENGYIRLGFNEEPEYITEETPAERGKNELNAFEYKMQKGDIVLSCYSNKEIDAIGIITSDYYVDKENRSDYWRFRNVKWLVKNIQENIYELNNQTVMTLSSVYKLSIPIQSVLDIVKKYTNPTSVSVDKPYVFIIDEINRGELSKIFGELFFAIEPGYRGKKGIVQTQYQNLIPDGDAFKKGFYIPKNVYVIGTMNDIDRSVESMDLAMRRRFTFKEITAEDSSNEMLSRNNKSLPDLDDSLINELKERMKKLNEVIISEEIGLSSAYQIGAAYFLKYMMYMDEVNPFECLWNYNLEPLLVEYLRGQGDIAEKIERLKDTYNLISKN